MNKNIIFLKPYLNEKIWGGNNLTKFNIPIPKKERIGEAWIISGIKEKSSTIVGGLYDGESLNEFYRKHKIFFDNYPSKEYPLLVKLLDCNQDLSIQVHPTKKYVATHKNIFTKTEAWFVLNAKKKSSIIYGHNAKTKKEFVTLVRSEKWRTLLVNKSVKKHDLFYVPSGTLHALKSGLIIFEIQQASDTTFRLYDYGREKTDSTRVLTTDDAIENTLIPFKFPKLKNIEGELLTSPYFSIKLIKNKHTNVYNIPQARWLQCFAISGNGFVNSCSISKGAVFIVNSQQKTLIISGNIVLLITYIRN